MDIPGNDFDPFGVLLHAFRKRRQLTQQQLAVTVSMHRHEISRWEHGEVLPASKAIVLELAKHLHLSGQEARQLLNASLTAPAPLWGVPLSRNLFFTGREDLLETLHRSLEVNQTVSCTQPYALQGLGGIGKTQTALEYAYRYALEYRAIFWIEAETLERVQFSLRHIAELLQLPERLAAEQQRMIEAVQRWFSTHDQWLLIWDNLEDLELPYRVLPTTRQGNFLITTRCQALGTLAKGITLRPLDQEESIALLLRRAKVVELEVTDTQVHQLATSRPAEYTAASELLTLLGGLPLALDQAGAYIEETGCSIADYVQRYQQQQGFLLNRRGTVRSTHPQSVTATFTLLQESAEQTQTGAADLLRVCAFLHAEAIPEELFSGGGAHLGPTLAPRTSDPLQFDLLLAALRNRSLVHRQAETHTLSLHRLVQVVLREQMGPVEERLWSERVIRLVHSLFPYGGFSTWEQSERYLPQVLACVPLIALWGTNMSEAGELLTRAGRYLLERGRLSEVDPLLAQAVALEEKRHGPSHPALFPSLGTQVELLWKQGRYACAQELSSRLLTMEMQYLGSTHVQVADTLNTQALLFWEQGHYERAEPLFQQALSIWEEHHHPDRVDALNNLALLYSDQGKYTQAETLLLQVLHLGKPGQGSDHPELTFPLHNLAILYRKQGLYVQAEPLFQRALSIREQTLGSDHPDVAIVLSNLALLYREQGKYAQAEQLFQRALRIQELVLGPYHRQFAFSLAGLAKLSFEQGEYERAEELFRQALQIRERCLPASHVETVKNRIDLALVYEMSGNNELAEQLRQRAPETLP